MSQVKKAIWGLGMGIVGILLANPALAVSEPYLDRSNPLKKFEFGMEVYSFNYEEPNFMEDEGVLYGGFATWEARSQENAPIDSIKDLFSRTSTLNMGKIDVRLAGGKVDYTSNGTGSVDDITDWVFEVRGVTGYDFPIFSASRITPYLGLGYRYLNDDSSGKITTTGAAGYERESNYIYMPIGFEIFTDMGNSWTVQTNVEYDIFLDGKQESHLGDAITGLSSVENDQDDGYGVRGSIKITKQRDEFDIFFEPFVRYWHVDDSEISPISYGGVLVGFGLEPENETLEAGARIGVSF